MAGATVKGIVAIIPQSCPPKSKFSPDQMPDLTGKVVIVTGMSHYRDHANRPLYLVFN